MADVSLMTKRLKRRCRSGWDKSQKTSMLRVSTHWESDGTSVSMLVEDKSRNKCFFSRLEYHMFYVLYPFVTYLLALTRTYGRLCTLEIFLMVRRTLFCSAAMLRGRCLSLIPRRDKRKPLLIWSVPYGGLVQCLRLSAHFSIGSRF
jgi:hypothetical protein